MNLERDGDGMEWSSVGGGRISRLWVLDQDPNQTDGEPSAVVPCGGNREVGS